MQTTDASNQEAPANIGLVKDYSSLTVEIFSRLSRLRTLLPLRDYPRALEEAKQLHAAAESLKDWIMERT